MVNDFRPISLFSWVHKLVACIYISRLFTVTDSLVSFTQMTFIQGRNIYDGWILTAELVDLMKKNNSGNIFKLDFKKAYDQVNWDFLWFIMQQVSFGDR